jgi:hypothetical protein
MIYLDYFLIEEGVKFNDYCIIEERSVLRLDIKLGA